MRFRQIALVEPLTGEEWRCIDVFKERALELTEELGKLHPKEFTLFCERKPDGGYRGSFTVPAMNDLLSLFVRFRLLHANDEPSNFLRVANIVARRAGPGLLCRFMDHLKAQVRDDLVEGGFFEIDGKRLRGDHLVDVWFNARIFHSDLEKRQELERLAKHLSDEGLKSLLFLAVFSACCAAKNLYYVIKDMAPDNPYVQVPEQFIRREQEPGAP